MTEISGSGTDLVQPVASTSTSEASAVTPECDADNSTTDNVQPVAKATEPSPVTPEIIRPFPKAAARKTKNNGRKKSQTRILTDTPEKKKIQEADTLRKQKQKRSASKTGDKNKENLGKPTPKNKRKKKMKNQDIREMVEVETDDSDDVPLAEKMTFASDVDACSSCKFVYGDKSDPKINDKWISCNCGKWFHETCAELDGIFDDDSFQCRWCV